MTKLVAKVVFENSSYNSYVKEYNFQTDIPELEEGTNLVVETTNGLQIAKFVGYAELGFGTEVDSKKYPSRWVIQKVDLDAHNTRVEKAERAKKLKILLEVERKKAAELEIYEILAKQNPAMAELLNEYKTIQEEI